ncbi:MAG: PAS domain S-box protein [Geobacter sp.]|nr:MAG: PAS domain S-box protein [Geobacter sp.]
MIHDITAQTISGKTHTESGRRFMEMLESLALIILILDKDANIVFANDFLFKTTGWSRAEVAGKNWFDVFIPRELTAEIQQVFDDSIMMKGAAHYENEIRTRQGDLRLIRWSNTWLRDAEGNIEGTASIGEDITELRQARQEMLKMQKLESLGILAGGIAHDFNNILTTILANVSLARIQVHDPEEVSRRLTEAENAIFRARDLTQQLLTFAQGGQPVKKTIQVAPLLREAADFAIQSSQVRCDFVLSDDLWLVDADEGQLSRVVHNLVLNAVQAMPHGGTVTVRAQNVSPMQENKKAVKISVSDNGIGIPEHHLETIFDPYFTTKQQGSGLGLTTCFSIIKKHEGKITVESTLSQGTTFHVYLPASERKTAVEPRSQNEVVHGSGRILVVDDQELVRETTQAMLEELGYTADCAENGAEAVELYRKRKEEGKSFAAVIMDLTIPGGMGGKEAIHALLKIDPEVRAVICSGYSTDPVLANYREYGFSAVLAKPYRLHELSRVLQELFG